MSPDMFASRNSPMPLEHVFPLTRRRQPRRPAAATIGLAIVAALSLASCSSELPSPPPPVPAAPDNLLAQFLEDGLPVELKTFSSPAGAYHVEIVEGGHEGKQSLLLEGDGQYGGINLPTVTLEGRKTYIATVYVQAERGEVVLKMDYLQDGKRIGSTAALPARTDSENWQQLVLLSQRSKYPRSTQISVVAICRGDARARFDDFRLHAQ